VKFFSVANFGAQGASSSSSQGRRSAVGLGDSKRIVIPLKAQTAVVGQSEKVSPA
jgi:hypothetical protein